MLLRFIGNLAFIVFAVCLFGYLIATGMIVNVLYGLAITFVLGVISGLADVLGAILEHFARPYLAGRSPPSPKRR